MTLEELEKQNAELQKALDEAKKSTGGLDEEERKRLEHLAAENKELIAARDKAKQKAREIEEAKLLENEEFKTLAEKRQAELEALIAKQEQYQTTLQTYEERDKKRLEALVEKVPEKLRPLIKESFPLPDRLELAESLAQTEQKPPGTRLPGEGGTDQPKTSVAKIAAGLAKL